MGTLQEALLKSGKVTEEQFHKQKTEEEIKEIERISGRKFNEKNTCDDLDVCLTVQDFRILAKAILLQDPVMITEVIRRVHRFKEREGGKKLIWLMYQIRDKLIKLPPKDHVIFLNRALRRSNSTLELPAKTIK